MRHRPGRRELLRKQPAEHKRPAVTFRLGHIAGRLDEFREPLVADRVGVDPERADRDVVHRPFTVLGVTVRRIAPHQQLPALQAYRPGRRVRRRVCVRLRKKRGGRLIRTLAPGTRGRATVL